MKIGVFALLFAVVIMLVLWISSKDTALVTEQYSQTCGTYVINVATVLDQFDEVDSPAMRKDNQIKKDIETNSDELNALKKRYSELQNANADGQINNQEWDKLNDQIQLQKQRLEAAQEQSRTFKLKVRKAFEKIVNEHIKHYAEQKPYICSVIYEGIAYVSPQLDITTDFIQNANFRDAIRQIDIEE